MTTFANFAKIWVETLETFKSSGLAPEFLKNRNVFFGKDIYRLDDLPGKHSTLSFHIKELTGNDISGSALLAYHAQIQAYFSGKNNSDQFSIAPQKINILKEYIQKGSKIREKKMYSSTKELSLTNIKDQKINKFFGTYWYVYSYEERASTELIFGKHKPVKVKGIGRTIMHIDENGSVEIMNLENPKLDDKDSNSIYGDYYTDYFGSVILDSNRLVFELKTHTEEKDLKINMLINSGTIFPFAGGIYTNVDYRGALIAGTMLMERVFNEKTIQSEDFKPEFFAIGSKEYRTLEPSIRKYFRKKQLNFLKVPIEFSSLNDLNLWLQRKKIEQRFQPDRYTNFDFDVFISSPVSSIDEKKYPISRSEILKVIEALKRHKGFNSIHYVGQEHESNTDLWKRNVVEYNKVLKNIENSRYFILIYPEKVVSSALVETGWALCLKKPIIIFHKQKENLPFILQNPDYVRNMVSVKMIPYNSISEITEYIQFDKKLFNWP